MDEPSRQQDLSVSDIISMFGLDGANLEHSVTTNDQNPFDIGSLTAPSKAVPMNPSSREGKERHSDASSSSIHDPNRGSCQSRSSHGGMNRTSTDRPSHSHKRSAPEDPPSKFNKKRKIELPPKVPPAHESSTSSPPSGAHEPSSGGKEPKAKPLSTIREEDYYFRQNTSLEDQTYFDNIIQNLRGAFYLRLQKPEPTISSGEGAALVGKVRAKGHGRASGDESVYAILVDKPPSGSFRCWICGHSEKQRKALRDLGHVREHFGHRPWECTQDHTTVKDENGQPKKRQARGQAGPW